jgi:hypothetical protein
VCGLGRAVLRLRRSVRANPKAEEGPATLVGQWLSAAVRRQHRLRSRLLAKLQATRWHHAEAVAEAAFAIAVRQAHEPGWLPASPKDMADGMRSHFGVDGVDRVPQDEAVRLIRAAMGEPVRTDDIPAGVAFMIHALVFVGLAIDLEYDPANVASVLRQAEEVARHNGYAPTIADGPREH